MFNDSFVLFYLLLYSLVSVSSHADDFCVFSILCCWFSAWLCSTQRTRYRSISLRFCSRAITWTENDASEKELIGGTSTAGGGIVSVTTLDG